MLPLVRDLVTSALGLLPKPEDIPHAIRSARLSELRLLLAEAQAQWPLWPAGARNLVRRLTDVVEGRADRVPAGTISGACDDKWPSTARAEQGRATAWLRRADCGFGDEGAQGA